MGKRRHQHNNKQSKTRASSAPATPRPTIATFEKKPPVHYGKPFVLLEDAQKSTFIYTGSQWVRHTKSIAECKLDCQVKELAQKINGMTRYEVCAPISSEG